MARPLHSYVPAVGFVVLLAVSGCFIPPTLGTEKQDAGVNSPPAILKVTADLMDLTEEPGPVLFEVGKGTMNLTVIDTDLDDTLYPKLFVDYNKPERTSPRSTCTPALGGTALRTSTCDLAGLCFMADVGQQRVMTIVVFDREVVESGMPLHQAMPPGGLSTSRTYFLSCSNPSPS